MTPSAEAMVVVSGVLMTTSQGWIMRFSDSELLIRLVVYRHGRPGNIRPPTDVGQMRERTDRPTDMESVRGSAPRG